MNPCSSHPFRPGKNLVLLLAFMLLGSTGWQSAAMGGEAAPPPSGAAVAKPEPKAAEAKPAETKPPEAKSPAAKPPDAKPEAKPDAKPPDAKPPAAKPEAKPEPKPEAKAPETKPPAAKPPEAKPEAKPEVKPEAKPETKPPAAKPPEAKPEAKPAAKPPEAKPEPRLKFNYRYLRWLDVLKELADRAGLSLVLPEAPPPGTFNYTSTREYTPSEAIDVLNGVLLIKGYTLIRRERMLVVVDLSEGIPEGLIPEVPLDKLGERGQFELVTVLFDLKGRGASTVEAEVKPLLGAYGKTVPLSAPGKLRVTDTAGSMKAISEVIDAMPIPPVVPKPSPPETPSLAVYPLKGADAETALKVLEKLVPTAKVVVDAKAEQLHVQAGPSVHATIKTVLEQMQSAGPTEKKPRLELYPVEESSVSALMKTLESIVPSAKISLDARTGKLAVWAPGSEHETIKSLLEKLGGSPTLDRTRQFEVYRLTKVDPKSTLAMLELMFPRAKMAVDMEARALVVIALPDEQKAIKGVLAQLQPVKPGPDAPELRYYPLSNLPATSLVAALERLLPQAKVTEDTAGRRLMVVASAADHAIIKTAVEQHEKQPLERPKVVIYPVAPIQQKRFEAMSKTLSSQLPGVQVLPGTEPGELAIWAKSDQQKMVAELLEQLKTETPKAEKYTLVPYPITSGDTTAAVAMLKSLYPNVEVVPDAKGSRLLVWAHPTEQASIKAALEQLQAPVPPEKQPRFETYPLYGIDATALTKDLQQLVPSAKLSTDAKLNKLVVLGTQADHDAVKAALEKLGRGTGLESTPQVEVYRLTRADSATIVPLLQSLVPEAKVSVDPQTKNLIVVAIPADQKAIRSLLDQIQPGSKVAGDVEPRFETYPLYGIDATALTKDLQQLVPNARLSVDAKSNRLVVLGTPSDHDAVKAALEKLGRAPGVEGVPQLEVYPLTRVDSSTVVTTLQGLVPDAKLSVDSQSKRLIAMAVPADHKTIRRVLDQLQPDKPGPDTPQLRFYSLSQAPSTSMVSVLQALVPKAQVTVDAPGRRMTVVATPADHEVVRAAVEQLERSALLEEKNRLITYLLTPAQRKQVQSVLTTLTAEMPGIQVLPESEPGELSIWAKPSQHVMIGQILDQVNRNVPGAGKYVLVAYPIRAADPASVLAVMKKLFLHVDFTLDTKARRLIVWALPAEQEQIKGAMDKLDAAIPPELQDKLNVYPVPADMDPATVIKVLEEQLPDVKFSTDPKAGTILAWGRQRDHTLIQKLIKQMREGIDAERKPQLVVYPGFEGDLTAISLIVKALVPKAQVAIDPKKGTLAATATPQEQELIRAAVEQMSKEEPPETAHRFATYTVDSARRGALTALISILGEHFPNAKFGPGLERGQVLVWARPADQDAVKKTIDELTKDAPEESTYKLIVYTLESGGAGAVTNAIPILKAIFPDGFFGPGTDPDKLAAWARPADQARIKGIIDQIAKKEPPEKARKVVIYPFQSVSPTAAIYTITMLRTMFPDAQFSRGAEPDKLVVFARPADQALIKPAVEQLSQKDPPEQAKRLVVHTLDSTSPSGVTGAISMLTTMYAQATFTAGTEPDKILAWAKPDEQKQIAATLAELGKKESPETARKVAIYPFQSASPTSAIYTITMLRTLFPDAQFSRGAEPDKLVVFARPADHAQIKSTVEQLSQKDPPEQAKRLVVHTLDSTSPSGVTGAIGMLTSMYPQATFTAGTEPDKILAWARPDEQKQVAATIAELGKKESPETARKVAVYPFQSVSPTSAIYTITMLRTLFPDAQFSRGAEPDKLVVFARPADHAQIKTTVEQLSQKDPPERAKRLVVHTLDSTSPSGVTGAIGMLTSMYPQATFSAGTEPDKILAWTRPDDQKQIAATVAELGRKEPPERARRLAVYTMESGGPYGASYAITALRAAFPDALLSLGSDPKRVVVWARADDHKAIAQSIEEISKGAELSAQVYRLESAAPSSAYTILSTLVPNALIALDTSNRSLVVSATPEDHKKIKATIDQMEAGDEKGREQRLEVHPCKAIDPAEMVTVLQGVFRLRPDVQLSVDKRNDAVVALAGPAQHERIRSLISQAEKAAAADPGVRLQVYPLKDSDPTATLRTLNLLLEKQGVRAEVSLDARTGGLVAIARPEAHKAIKEALDQVPSVEQTLEIVQLEVLEPSTAELAVQRLFSDRGGYGRAGAPSVDVDAATQQLFVNATAEQHVKIRELLVKMGETGLAGAPGGAGPRSRVVPFEGDVERALEHIQKVWPQLRSNPLRVVGPSPGRSPDKKSPDKRGADKKSPPSPPGDRIRPAAGPNQTPPAALPKNEAVPPEGWRPHRDEASQAGRPVFLVPGEGRITITSDDPEAVRQVEELLRAFSQPRGIVARNYGVYMLQNAKASAVGPVLQGMFRRMPGSGSRGYGSVVIVPDDRLNALVVYANRTDRATIESLLRVLDSSEMPESLMSDRIQMLPVKNTNAVRMQRMLQDLYGTQLAPISVEEKTNSLIVMAAPATFAEIKRVVELLDSSAGGQSARTIEILRLHTASAERVEQALNIILREAPRRTRGPTPRTRPRAGG